MTATAHIVWAVTNSVWQSGLVAVLAWIVLRGVRGTTAALRYAVWTGVLIAAAALPLVNAAIPATPRTLPAAAPAIEVSATTQVRHAPTRAMTEVSHAKESALPRIIGARYQPDPATSTPSLIDAAVAAFTRSAQWIGDRAALIMSLWGVASALMLVRLATGYGRLRHIKRGLVVLNDEFIASSLRASPRRASVGASHDVDCPCVIGYVRPVVALPAALVRDLGRADLSRILAHELAHVRRWDDWGNLLQQVVRAIWFVNPVVHLACRQLDVDREIACDDLVAAAHGDRLEYAKCLTEIARRTTFAEHLVPAAGFFPDRKQIVVRIEQLLDRNHNGSARVGAVPAVCAFVLALAVLALAKYQIPAFAGSAPPQPPARAEWSAPSVAAQVPVVHVRAIAVAAAGEYTPKMSPTAKAPVARVTLYAESTLAPLAVAPRARIGQLSAALKSLTLRDPAALIGLRLKQPVVAPAPLAPSAPVAPIAPLARTTGSGSLDDFLDALAAAGYAHLSVDELIAVRNAGVTSDYLRALKKYGVAPMPIVKLISLANAGVDASYIVGVRAAGYGDLSADELIGMANAGVSPEFAKAAATNLRPRPALKDLVAMANAGVSPAYITNMAKLGYAGLSVDSLVALANAGVSSSYVASITKLGYAHMSVDALVKLANAGVSPSYVKSLADVGYGGISVDDLIRLANSGVSAKLIKSLRDHGIGDHGNLSVDELIKLANAGF